MDQRVFRPLGGAALPVLPAKKAPNKTEAGTGFAAQLKKASFSETGSLAVSKHAQKRLEQRNIEIDSGTWMRIEDKVKEARKLGVTDSLVLTREAALVISAKNNTVITAMDRDEAKSQIFTNINGTILMDQ